MQRNYQAVFSTPSTDNKFQSDLVARGHEQAKKFTWKQSAKKLYDICSDLRKNQ